MSISKQKISVKILQELNIVPSSLRLEGQDEDEGEGFCADRQSFKNRKLWKKATVRDFVLHGCQIRKAE